MLASTLEKLLNIPLLHLRQGLIQRHHLLNYADLFYLYPIVLITVTTFILFIAQGLFPAVAVQFVRVWPEISAQTR